MTSDPDLNLLDSMVARAKKLVVELEQTYIRDLEARTVSAEALNLTHEIIEKCSNTLDQAMSLLFKREIEPLIAEPPTRGGYFPAAKDEHSYRSTLGQWNASALHSLAPDIDSKLRSLQPFASAENAIYARIKLLAGTKHTGLAPQKRLEQRRVNVTRPGAGGVSWGSSTTFGPGVRVMGVPINPVTQMPAHTDGINVSVEKWISFHFDDGEDALTFCKAAVKATQRAIDILLR